MAKSKYEIIKISGLNWKDIANGGTDIIDSIMVSNREPATINFSLIFAEKTIDGTTSEGTNPSYIRYKAPVLSGGSITITDTFLREAFFADLVVTTVDAKTIPLTGYSFLVTLGDATDEADLIIKKR